jgi:hypothetical protein
MSGLASADVGDGSVDGTGDSKGSLTLAVENDLFGAGTDEHYTHGTEITYVSDTYQPDWLKSFASGVGLYAAGDDLRVVWSLGQQMYTPADVSRTDLIVDDRPYAGWLYTSLGMFTDSQQRATVRNINKLELIVGVVGPQSGAKNTQKLVHKWTDSRQPEGWDNQLHDETTVDVQYQHEWIIPLVANYIDIVPRVATTVGTSQRNAGAGFSLRIGSGLNADAGPPLIRPSAAGSQYFKSGQSFYWYLFAGAHGRYVWENIFLDGNEDGNSHSVDKNHWVGEVQGGAVMGWENWRFTLTEIYRSREFETQLEPDEFGSLAVSYRF